MLSAIAFFTTAQTPVDKPEKFNHYGGVQINQLLKQIINLNNNNAPITNPYLLTYTISTVKGGWNLHMGIGYDYKRILDKNTPANHESKISDLNYRVGVGQTVMFGKKFEAGYGLDYTAEHKVDKTFSTSVTNFGNGIDSSATTSTSKTTSKGFGAQFTLSFHISDRVLIGTETTYYYADATQKLNVLITETVTNDFNNTTIVTTTNTNLETETSSFTFSVPVAIFLLLKF